MSRTTIAGATAELFALLGDTDGNPVSTLEDAGVTKAYPSEPGATGWKHPCSVTLQFAGWEPTNWRYAVRVYVADLNPVDAQDQVIAAITAVDQALGDGGFAGPSMGECQWVEELQCWLAYSEILVGREDGF